jgi:hypothetical protein
VYNLKRHIFIVMFVLISAFLCYNLLKAHIFDSIYSSNNKSKYTIFVDINAKKLYLVDNILQKAIKSYPIASGKDSTPSPLGTWKVISKGEWGKWFGGRWIGIDVPWGTYGIHGTNRPYSIGHSASHGCIRMFNKDIDDLYKYVDYGTFVVIYGGPYGPFGNGFRTLKPGDTGSDVYYVQKVMKQKGYYSGNINGIYGEQMKRCVIKFRMDNNLGISHNIDASVYKALGIVLMD